MEEKLEEMLEEYCSHYDDGGDRVFNDYGVRELLKCISEQDNWISVEERLPTEKDADENGKVLVCHKSMSGEKWNKFFADWDKIGYLTWVEIYWQPLPTPPKVKETEK